MQLKSRLLLIIVMLFAGVSANATTFVNEFPIYLYGDVTFIATVYEFVKSFTGQILDGGSAVQLIMGLGTTVSILIMGYRAKDGGVASIGTGIIAPAALIALFFVPTVDVHITDLRVDKGLINYSVPDGGYRVVEDVPYAIAAIPSISSTIVSFFIDTIDDNWFGVNLGGKFSSLGFQGISNISKDAMLFAKLSSISDLNGTVTGKMTRDLNQYIRKCLINKALAVAGNKKILYSPSKPFPDMFDPSIYNGNIGAETVSFDDGIDAYGIGVNGDATSTCSKLYTKYVANVSNDIETGMKKILKSRHQEIDPDSASLNEAYRDQIGDTVALIGNIGKAMATISTTRALQQDLEIEGIGVNGATVGIAISIESTMSNLRTEGLAKFDWISRTLPDAITILLAVMIGVFPIMIVVMSFYGAAAFTMIANFFMGYIAINFNLVGLALVSNIISYYTAQHAQEAIVSYAGMPFGLSQVNDFMLSQADMAGFAGIIGAVAVMAITPLVFKGETAGLAAATGAISGMYRGNVAASAQKELADYDAQSKLDERFRATTIDGMSEAEASAWHSNEGFSKPNSMSAVESYNNMMKNYQQIGSADAASILHSGNGDFNAQNYMKGSGGQAMQKAGATAGFGSQMGVGEGQASMADIQSISVEDGVSQAAMIDKTQSLRHANDKLDKNGDVVSSGYDATAVGAGQAISAHAKNLASEKLNELDTDAKASVANATSAVAGQVAAGQGLLKTGAFDADGSFDQDSMKGQDFMKGSSAQAREKFEGVAGYGSTVDSDATAWKANQLAADSGQSQSDVAKLMQSDKVDDHGRKFYDSAQNVLGQVTTELGALQGTMQTGKGIQEEKNGEDQEEALMNAVQGIGAQSRKSINDSIGVGKDFSSMTDDEQTKLMSKTQEIGKRAFRGGIESQYSDLTTGVDKDGHTYKRSADQAITDDVTLATEKAIGSSAHASNLREKYGSNLTSKGDIVSDAQKQDAQDQLDSNNAKIKELSKRNASKEDIAEIATLGDQNTALQSTIDNKESMRLAQATSTIDQSKLESQLGQAAGVAANTAAGVNYAQNAMYGEESQQQSTQAKIETQGGVSAAVNTDVADASLKASKQQAATSGELAQQMIASGMKADDAKKISEEFTRGGEDAARKMAESLNKGAELKTDINVANSAISGAVASAGALAGTMAEGKTAGDIKSVDEANRLYEDRGGYVGYQRDAAMVKTQGGVGDTKGLMDVPEEHRENFIQKSLDETEKKLGKEKRNELQESYNRAGLMNGDDITPENWVSGTGYLRANNMNSSNALVAAGMSISGALGEDSKVNIDALDSVKSGSETSHSNDVVKINNTDTQTQIAMARKNDNIQEAAEYSKKVDAVKYGMDPRNEIAHAGAEAAEAIASATGMDGEAAALLATGVGAGGLAIANKYSKEPVQFSQSQREKLTKIKGEDGELKGYANSKGTRVADKEGFALDKAGKKIESGIVGRAIRGSGNKFTELTDKVRGISPETSDNTKNGGTDNQDGKNNNGSSDHKHSSNINEGKNPSSETSIPKSNETGKSIADKHLDGEAKMGKVSPAPNVVGEPKPQYGSPLSEAGTVSTKQPSLAQRINSWFSGGESGGKGNGRIKMAATLATPLIASYALSGTDAEARDIPSASPKLSTPAKPVAPSQTNEVLHAASNVTGAAEMGVGLTTMAADVASHIPGQTGNIAKGIAKFGARVTPGLGMAYGAADGAYRTSQGDYLGASMSAGIAAASTVPVFGTALAVAGGVAQMATDYYGITGGSNSPAPAHAQNAFSTPSGVNTGAAIQADFNAGKVVSFVSPQNTPVPAHVQNAFSSPTGSNTMSAMNGGYNPSDSKNAYNDTTSNVNGTPSEYQTSTNQTSLDKLDDISIGTEYSQDETSRMAEAMERLNDTIYSGGSGENGEG